MSVGCYSDQEDLNKLNLEKAKHVYILTWTVENSNVKDSGILPLIRIIEENYPKCNYTLELSDELNVRYLSTNKRNNKIDSLLNKQSIVNTENLQKQEKIPFIMWPKYAESDIFFSSSLDSLLAFNYHNEGILDIMAKLLGINHNLKDESIENNDICTFKYIGEDRFLYDKIFNIFISLDKPLIPIAVYRWDSDLELKNKSHYIITNPKKELLLNKNDKIICIGIPEDNIFDTTDYFVPISSEGSESDDIHSDLENSEILNRINKESNQNSMLADLKEEEILERIQEEIKHIKRLSKQENSNTERNRSSLNMSFNNTLNDKLLSKFHKNNETKSVPINTAESNILQEKEINETISNINILPLSIKRHIEDIVQSTSFNNGNYNISINTKNEFQGNNIISINSSHKFSNLQVDTQKIVI